MTEDTDEGWILVGARDRVATVTLNRPDRLNALPPEMRADLWRTLTELDADPGIRAIVLTGAGRGFCVGSDRGRLTGYTADEVDRRLRDQQHGSETILFMETPVIAAVNGSVAGLGFAIAVMADVRFSVPAAKWTTSFARLGLCAEAGLSQLLPRLVGHGWASDLLLSARVLDGAEAHRIGLVQYLVEPDELLPAAQAYAGSIAANSPWSLRTIRGQLRDDANDDLDEVLARTKRKVVGSIAGDDFAEAQRAMTERREPRFA
ncbi:enoyl-CoA hydratase-related protein [Actinomadura viridis]|uniref:enoyl-CoA hydratase-related protein n=1 Tax=Actinomadura viridis TaxID=58110 RepID=UPI003677086B